VFSAIFSNISAKSWRPLFVVKEAGVPEGTADHGQATDKLYHLRLRVKCTLFVILVICLVISLYQLLGNPTS